MKLTVSSYSFQEWVNSENKTQLDTIAKAKELGFTAIEFAGINPPDGISTAEYGKMLKDECDRLGMEISAIAYSADFINGCDGNTEAEIERVKGLVDIAASMGVKRIRHDAAWNAGKYENFDGALPVMAEACRKVTEYAAEKGVKTMVENHGFFAQDSERMERLFKAVNNPNFSLLTDMGNFMCADEESSAAVKRVAPIAGYVHAKDFYFSPASEGEKEGYFQTRGGNYLKGATIGKGTVPVLTCLQIFKEAGYDGFVAIEYEGGGDAIQGIKEGKEAMERYFSLL